MVRAVELPPGRLAEIRGAEHLHRLGYRLLACPYRAAHGEIDIVAMDGGTLVFVEVKERRTGERPEDAVNVTKRARIRAAAREYRRRYRRTDVPFRFDVLAAFPSDREFEFRLTRGAFNETEAPSV